MQLAMPKALGPIRVKLNLPGSIQITYRAILIAALADGVSEISGIKINKATLQLLHALRQLGIVAQLDEKTCSCIIAGGNGRFPKKQATIWCGNLMAIMQLLLVSCASSSGVYYMDGPPSLRHKRVGELLNLLVRQGVQFVPSDVEHLPFTLIGADSLEGGELSFVGTHATGRLLSNVLMLSPYARSPVVFTAPDLSNQPVIDLTCMLMAEFGVLVHRVHQGQLMVPVPQRYQARDYSIEPDFSIAPYFFAAAAITGGEVTIQPFKWTQSKQRDVCFLAILKKMGCQIFESSTGLTVKGPVHLRGADVVLPEFAASFLALVALAPFATSPTRILHTGRLRRNERARLTLAQEELVKLGVKFETGDKWIRICPTMSLANAVIAHDDYHIAMAFSIMALKSPRILVKDQGSIASHCPEFLSILKGLSQPEHAEA